MHILNCKTKFYSFFTVDFSFVRVAFTSAYLGIGVKTMCLEMTKAAGQDKIVRNFNILIFSLFTASSGLLYLYHYRQKSIQAPLAFTMSNSDGITIRRKYTDVGEVLGYLIDIESIR